MDAQGRGAVEDLHHPPTVVNGLEYVSIAEAAALRHLTVQAVRYHLRIKRQCRRRIGRQGGHRILMICLADWKAVELRHQDGQTVLIENKHVDISKVRQ